MSLFGGVSISYREESLPPIDVTIDASLLSMCEYVITVTPTINAPADEILKHTFMWEQVTGGSVTFDANVLTLSFARPASQEDRLFRFWSDRGTPQAQHHDVLVSFTPRSVAACSVSGGVHANGNISGAEIVGVASELPTAVYVYPSNDGAFDGSSITLYWTLSGDAGLTKVVVEQNTTGEYVAVHTSTSVTGDSVILHANAPTRLRLCYKRGMHDYFCLTPSYWLWEPYLRYVSTDVTGLRATNATMQVTTPGRQTLSALNNTSSSAIAANPTVTVAQTISRQTLVQQNTSSAASTQVSPNATLQRTLTFYGHGTVGG